jgi:hypothetical protein
MKTRLHLPRAALVEQRVESRPCDGHTPTLPLSGPRHCADAPFFLRLGQIGPPPFGTSRREEVIGLRKHRGRLTEPLVRENGTLRPASWDEALDFAAAGLDRARAQDTTRSFGMFSCSKASNEVNFLAQKFVRSVMGSNNIDSCNRT